MNLGYLNGYFSKYRIINTQYVAASDCYSLAQNSDYSGWGTFIVPIGASHALVTACAKGGANGALDNGGGGAGACFRVPMPIRDFKHIPYGFSDALYGGVVIGANAYGQVDLSTGVLDSMISITLTNGASAPAGNAGGAGGSATVYHRHNGSLTAPIVASGGAAGTTTPTLPGAGQVLTVFGGGIIAGGGGGGTSVGQRGGDVPAPWGTMFGGAWTGSHGCGGASLLSHGYGQSFNLPGVFSTPGLTHAAPGAGQCGNGFQGSTTKGTAFIYIEFIAPIDKMETY